MNYFRLVELVLVGGGSYVLGQVNGELFLLLLTACAVAFALLDHRAL